MTQLRGPVFRSIPLRGVVSFPGNLVDRSLHKSCPFTVAMAPATRSLRSSTRLSAAAASPAEEKKAPATTKAAPPPKQKSKPAKEEKADDEPVKSHGGRKRKVDPEPEAEPEDAKPAKKAKVRSSLLSPWHNF